MYLNIYPEDTGYTVKFIEMSQHVGYSRGQVILVGKLCVINFGTNAYLYSVISPIPGTETKKSYD